VCANAQALKTELVIYVDKYSNWIIHYLELAALLFLFITSDNQEFTESPFLT
jgi:hypothetical protein